MKEEERFALDETLGHIYMVQKYLGYVVMGLTERMIAHDDSKVQQEEFDGFVKYTPKLKGMTYGSDEYKKCLEEMRPILNHHYRENRHHPEHHLEGIKGMSLLDITEMLMDWLAAVQRHDDGNIFKSIEHNAKRFGYSDELKQIMHNTVNEIAVMMGENCDIRDVEGEE